MKKNKKKIKYSNKKVPRVKPGMKRSIKLAEMEFPGENLLSPRQELFCHEYCLDLNGAQAAIRAGYSPHTARQQACALLSNLYIRNRINKELEKVKDKIGIKREHLMSELIKVMLADIGDYVTLQGGRRLKVRDFKKVDTSVISEISNTVAGIKFKLHDKVRAIELLGKMLGIWIDKTEHSGLIGDITVKFSNIDFEKKNDRP